MKDTFPPEMAEVVSSVTPNIESSRVTPHKKALSVGLEQTMLLQELQDLKDVNENNAAGLSKVITPAAQRTNVVAKS